MPTDHQYPTRAQIKQNIAAWRARRLREARRKVASWERMKAAYAAARA